jgi:hypothetical protein
MRPRSGQTLFKWDTIHYYADWDDSYGATYFLESGLKVESRPHDTTQYRRTALERGYSASDIGRMSVEHDFLHTYLSTIRHDPWSPTLHAVASGAHQRALETNNRILLDCIDREEWLVAEFTRMLNGMTVMEEGPLYWWLQQYGVDLEWAAHNALRLLRQRT